MSATRVSTIVLGVAASLASCTGTGDVEYAGEVRVASPELVEISPGVHVIADADEPLFYSDGFYWLHRDGHWLRSDDYRRGFVRVELSYVPEPVRGIERPQIYVQYRRRMGRDYQARVRQQQAAPSPPPPETWQPGEPGVTPTTPTPPRPTPPITSPADVHGTPMPPHQVPPIDVDRPYGDSQMPDRVPPRQDTGPAMPPGTASDRDRATPPSPPSPNDSKNEKEKNKHKNHR